MRKLLLVLMVMSSLLYNCPAPGQLAEPTQSSNASLANLTISSGTLNPVFNKNTTSYTADVGNDITSTTVIPVKEDVNASIQVRINSGAYSSVNSGSSSGALNLNVGTNTIDIQVKAQNATIKIYFITVTRAGSSNARLSALSISSGILSPAFTASTNAYSVSVTNATTSITVTPTKQDVGLGIQVRINGGAYTNVTSGNPSGSLSLNVGTNLIEILVTAQDSSTNTYSITVTRAGSSNARLSALSISSGILSPAFTASTNAYSVSVTNATTSITVTPTKQDVGSGIQVRINGGAYTNVTSGNPSGSLSLNVGTNLIEILVTAQDSSTNTYSITVTRAGSSNARLSALSISSGILSPAFSSSTNAYSVSVTNTTTSVTTTSTKQDAGSNIQVRVNGGTYIDAVSGNPSGSLSLNVGTNLIEILVTAQDNSTNTYSITVTRAGSSNANLSNVVISSGTLSPTFSSSTNAYSVSVTNATTSVTVTSVKQDIDASIRVRINGGTYANVTSGNPSGSLSLNVGTNLIEILVTAQDSSTNTYSITVTRAGSSNANLSNIVISSGTLIPAFSSTANAYSVSVTNATTSITVTPTKQDVNATIQVRVNGGAYANATSGSPSGSLSLNVGTNLIEILVTAQDSSTNTYSITVTRESSSNANLSILTISSGTLNPVFSSSTINYTVSLAYNIISVTVTPTKQDTNANIQVRVNGGTYSIVTSGTPSDSLSLNIGTNVIEILVTAQDSSTKVYTTNITRGSLPIPGNISASQNNTSRIVITWNSVTDAENYFIYRSTSENGTYTEIGTTTNTVYNDDTANPAIYYYYKIRSWSSIYNYSDYSSAYLGYVTLLTPINVIASDGTSTNIVAISWDLVNNADSYEIYRSLSSASGYSLLASVTSNSYENSSNSTPGVLYFYQIKACANSGVKSNNSIAESGFMDLTDPTTISATDDYLSRRIDVSWSSIAGATSYFVYRSTSELGTYSQIGSTATTPYSDTTIDFETTYYYKMKAYASSANIYTDFTNYDSGYCYLMSPNNATVTSNTATITISWATIAGVSRYYVSRSTSEFGTYTDLGYTNGSSYDDTTAALGTGYYYQVSSWDAVAGRDDTPGRSSIIYLIFSTPTNVGASEGYLSKIILKWDPVPSASTYKVYRSSSSTGSFSQWATTSGTTYTDNSTGTYYYKITASANSNGESAQTTAVMGCTGITLNAPENVSATDGTYSNQITITWNNVPAATNGYVLYRATSLNGSYTMLSASGGTSYTDYVSGGSTYYYKIKSSDGTNYSGFSIYDKGSTF